MLTAAGQSGACRKRRVGSRGRRRWRRSGSGRWGHESVAGRGWVRPPPPAFRERFGPEIIEDLREGWVAARARGRLAAFGFAVSAALYLLGAALAEHWKPSLRTTPHGGEGGVVLWRRTAGARTCGTRSGRSGARRDSRWWRSGPWGLALGVNAGIFSIVDAVLLRPLPFPEPDRLVYIGGTAPGSDLQGEFQLPARILPPVPGAVEAASGRRALRRFHQHPPRGRPRRAGADGRSRPPALFPTLGVARRGRVPTAEDEDRVALLSHGLWKSWFGGDTAVIGRSYYIAGQQRTVIGVMGRTSPSRWTASPSGSPPSSVRRTSSRASSGCGWSGGCGRA